MSGKGLSYFFSFPFFTRLIVYLFISTITGIVIGLLSWRHYKKKYSRF
jgi:hypothetical protein